MKLPVLINGRYNVLYLGILNFTPEYIFAVQNALQKCLWIRRIPSREAKFAQFGQIKIYWLKTVFKKFGYMFEKENVYD